MNMLEKLIQQEQELKRKEVLNESKGYLSPKINVEELLRNGCITADDYYKSINDGNI